MKIVKETPNLMILKDRNIVTFFIGTFFCLIGLLLIIFPDFIKEKPPLLLSIFFILMGLFSIFKAKITTVSLNKGINKLSLERKTIMSRKKEEYKLDEIKEVELQQQVYSHRSGGHDYGMRRQGYSYNLVLVLNNGQAISLPSSGRVVIMGKQIGGEQQIGKRISEFLNIPFKERRPPTLSESLSTIKEVVREEMQKNKKGRDDNINL